MTGSTVLSRTPDGWRPRFLLLVADPEMSDADILVKELKRQRVDVEICGTAADALLAAGALRPDAVLVAAEPGDLTCTQVVQALAKRTKTPVVVGIGDGQGEHAGAALTAGATACIARPYRLPELIPIMRSIRPDTIDTLTPPVEAGSLRLDPATLEVRMGTRPIRLPLREYHLLHFFMVHADRVVTRDQIYEAVWGGPDPETSNTVSVHIKRLRSRLGDDQRNPHIILTVRGVGYRLVPPPDSPSDTRDAVGS